MTRLLPFTVAIMIFFVALVVIIPRQAATFDTPTSIERLAIEQLDGSLRFYNVDNSGQFTLLIELNEFGFRSLHSYSYHRWDVLSPSSIVISPDGQRFAFAAVRDLEPETTTLFIYTIGDSNVQEVPIPGLASLRWSSLAPNYDAILLLPSNPYLVVETALSLDGLYLYNLVSGDLSKIDNSAYYGSIDWLPNGHQIIASKLESFCESPCISVDSLYVVDVGDSTDTVFTTVAPQLPPNLIDIPIDRCRSQKPAWSAINSRFYYALRCNLSGNDYYSYVIYSVDLLGNARLEADLINAYPNDDTTFSVSIHPSTNSGDVYVVTSGRTKRETDEYNVYVWRLYRIHAPRTWEVVAEDHEVFRNIIASALSPDSGRIAVSSMGNTWALVDLTDGEITYQNPVNNNIFLFDWLDKEHLLAFDSDGGSGKQPMGTWLYDLSTGERTNITEDMEGLVWIMPKPSTSLYYFIP